jgi:hypothetical protein
MPLTPPPFSHPAHDPAGLTGSVRLRPITERDEEFLFRVYASTRLEELAPTGWSGEQIEAFLRMQFSLQHTQYMENYKGADFSVILLGDVPVGRLYVKRTGSEMRVIDGGLMREIVGQADTKKLIVSLHVEMNNPVLPFYKTLGFMEKAIRGIYYYMERDAQGGSRA